MKKNSIRKMKILEHNRAKSGFETASKPFHKMYLNLLMRNTGTEIQHKQKYIERKKIIEIHRGRSKISYEDREKGVKGRETQVEGE